MAQEEKNVKEIEHPIGVRIDRSRLLQVVELKRPIDFQESRKTKNRNRTETQLNEIQRRQRKQIEDETRRTKIIHR